jgi:hypothetical protein
MPRTVPTLLALMLVAGCGSDHEVGALRAELQEQRMQIAELQEQVELQGDRLEAQSSILARLDDQRIAEARAPKPAADPPEWLRAEGDRIIIDRAKLPEPVELMKLFRAIPHKGTSGDTDGFRVMAIRSGSPLALMGLANGDVVHRIAGVDVTTIDGAMQAWQAAGAGGTFDVQLTTRGKARTLKIEMR